MLFRPKCVICEQPSATIEIVPPHTPPVEWAAWEEARQQVFTKYRDPASHQFLYNGPGGSNGWVGNPIDSARADRITAAFSAAPTAEAIKAAGFYDGAGFCASCAAFYCAEHWSISATGFGTCPRGHGKSLDPHLYPEFDD
jgi:hypothetical protein